jgi:hypothetical protein
LFRRFLNVKYHLGANYVRPTPSIWQESLSITRRQPTTFGSL